MNKPSGKGIVFAASSYILWGIFPLYWKILAAVNSFHILAFRILFSLLLVATILFVRKNFSWLSFYKDRRKALLLTLASISVTLSWGLFIWAVNAGYTLQTSLGYYINPLISIIFGLFIFREKLTILQWISFSLAMAGVLIQTILSGSLPWISLGLALSFGTYGLLKKTIQMPALETLGVECLIIAPLGLLLLFAPFTAVILPGWRGIGYMAELPAVTFVILAFSGAVTMVPLYLFSMGARMLPLSTLGFLQFIAPTMSFLLAYFVFNEPFPWYNFIVFGCIWIAVILYIISINIASGEKTDQ